MRKYKYLLCSICITLISVLILVLGNKIHVMSEYVNVVGELTTIKNETDLLEADYTQRINSLTQKGVIVSYETLEEFTKNLGDANVKEVSIFKYIDNSEELIAVVPSIYDAFSIKSGDMLCITYTINEDMETILGNLMLQKVVYKELKVLPLSSELQITFLI